MSLSSFRLLNATKEFLGQLFNLHDDKEREETTIEEIKKGVLFRGTNLYVLIFAILIASIGLNVNSTAVVIGAMLISPLMGPIMGIGLGAGINDLPLIKTAFKNLSVAVIISIATSTFYFWITPLHEAQSELLARTTPTLWDVLIAFFGGMAGIIAGSRKEKSNAIPGVAIATALMPPLCTAGYGLANGNLYYFIGAFYLFFINSVLISVSTFIIVRFLKYKRIQFESAANERKTKTYITFFVLLTIIPSSYLAYNLVTRTLFEQNARRYISTEFNFENTQVISQKFTKDGENEVVEILLFGKILDADEIEAVVNRRILYKLNNTHVVVRQGYQDDSKVSLAAMEFQKIGEKLKTGIIEDLYLKNEQNLREKNNRILALESEIEKIRSNYPIGDMLGELKIQYPTVQSLYIGDLIGAQQDTICHAFVKFPRPPLASDKRKIQKWLSLRTKADKLVAIFH